MINLIRNDQNSARENVKCNLFVLIYMCFKSRSPSGVETRHESISIESIVQDFSKRYKHISKVVNDQWKQFSKVYLNELRQHHMNRKEKC